MYVVGFSIGVGVINQPLALESVRLLYVVFAILCD